MKEKRQLSCYIIVLYIEAEELDIGFIYHIHTRARASQTTGARAPVNDHSYIFVLSRISLFIHV